MERFGQGFISPGLMGLGRVKNYWIKLNEEECCSCLFSIVVINTTVKSKLWEEKAYFTLQPIVHDERMSGQELRQEPGGRN